MPSPPKRTTSAVVIPLDAARTQARALDPANPSVPDALTGALTDTPPISARLAALAALLADQTDIALFRCDEAGALLEFNTHFLGLNHSSTALAIPGLVEAVATVLALNRAMVRSFALEVDGRRRHYYTRLLPVVDQEGRVTGVAGAFQDWTTHLSRLNIAREDQERFRDFARASSDWFWEVDAQGRLTAVSDRLTAILGKPAFSLVGENLDAIGRLDSNLRGERPIDTAIAQHTPFRDQLFLVENVEGEITLFHLSGVPLFDEDETFRGFRGAGMDVTRAYLVDEEARAARYRLESAMDELSAKNAALDVASAQAQNALETKNEFLAAMSHELRTPLNAIIGFAEAMQLEMFGPLQGHYRDYAKDIRTAGTHLLGLIDDILDVSVIESGEVALSLDSVHVGRAVEQAHALLLIRAEQKHLHWAIDAIAQDITVKADERRLRQILVNLFTNAVKFTPEGGSIGVRCARGGAFLPVPVWDTGPGIAQDNHERVFEKFQQCIGDAYRGKPEGAGLGLHISRELVRLMNGEISLQSKPGEGAAFTVSLPAAP
jgi:PAS domain S-box-containing protein